MSQTKHSLATRRGATRPAILTALVALGVSLPRVALADANACAGLHASGQREMKAGHLRSASKQFTACSSDESCPEAVRADCMELFENVERMIPTVIFSVVDQTGSDVTQVVKVYSGENLLVEGLDGRALAIDPGQHQFRFELPWGESMTSDVLIREGEKNRLVGVKAVDPNKAIAPAPETPVTTPAAPPSPVAPVVVNRTPVGFWVASGIGVAALGAGTVFALMGRAKHSDLADCSPTCDLAREDDYDAMKRDYLIGDIALGAGLVSVGVAAVIYFTAGASTEEAPSTARLPQLDVRPARSGVGGTVLFSGATF
jgi:hypothetical protein